MVIPILEYASIVWGDKNNKVLMDFIQVLQNKAAKLVLHRLGSSDAFFFNSSPSRSELDESINQMINATVFFLIHSFMNDSERNSRINQGSDYHSQNTRSKETIRTIRSNTNWGLLRSFNSALTDWNSLPEDTVYLIMLFKFSLLKHFKSQ